MDQHLLLQPKILSPLDGSFFLDLNTPVVIPAQASEDTLWNTLFPRIHNANVNIRNLVRDGVAAGAEGMLNTDWGDCGHYQHLGLSWYGYVFGAVQGWSGGTTTDEDFETAFGPLFFGPAHEQILQAIHKLDRTNMLPGVSEPNGSDTALALFDEPLTGGTITSLPPETLTEMQTLSEEASTILDGLAFGHPRELTLLEMTSAAHLTTYAARKTALSQAIRRDLHAPWPGCRPHLPPHPGHYRARQRPGAAAGRVRGALAIARASQRDPRDTGPLRPAACPLLRRHPIAKGAAADAAGRQTHRRRSEHLRCRRLSRPLAGVDELVTGDWRLAGKECSKHGNLYPSDHDDGNRGRHANNRQRGRGEAIGRLRPGRRAHHEHVLVAGKDRERRGMAVRGQEQSSTLRGTGAGHSSNSPLQRARDRGRADRQRKRGLSGVAG
jgi:hypothetical protein